MGNSPRVDQVPVDGATLFVTRVGEGPPLVVVQGGAGDADGSVDLAPQLADAFTVVSYDRRGQTRSPGPRPWPQTAVLTHAEDLSRLLSWLGDEPVAVMGTSIGAVIALEVLIRHPSQVRRLVAHEPPLRQLLDAGHRALLDKLQVDVETAANRNALAGMRVFVNAFGLATTEREPGIDGLPSPRMLENMKVFLAHDAPSTMTHEVNLEALEGVKSKLVLGIGKLSPPESLHAAPVVELGRRLRLPLETFAGGHGGYATHPRGFAEALRRCLSS